MELLKRTSFVPEGGGVIANLLDAASDFIEASRRGTSIWAVIGHEILTGGVSPDYTVNVKTSLTYQ